jgi:hypothetical protein
MSALSFTDVLASLFWFINTNDPHSINNPREYMLFLTEGILPKGWVLVCNASALFVLSTDEYRNMASTPHV